MMFVRPLPGVLIIAALLLLPAGRVVPAFTAYAALLWATFGTVYTVALRRSPDLVRERLTPPSDRDRATRRWVVPLLIVHYLLAGFDARLGWTPDVLRAWPIAITGLCFVAMGLALAGWSVLSNPYASSAVRVQRERAQTVVSAGPYAIVRHPMYLGVVLCSIGSPLALGSLPASPFVLAIIAVFVRRTLIEERILHHELDGYPAYAATVRWRVIPGVF